MGKNRSGRGAEISPELGQSAPLKLFGRKQGHRLHSGAVRRMDELLPALAVPRGDGALDPHSLFSGQYQEIWLEVGFGDGGHLAWQAEANPRIGFIGCEPYVNGVAKLLQRIELAGLGNIRIYQDDARHLLSRLPAASLALVFVLFPDPWHKKRHHKRRFIAPATLAELARVMRPGAELRFASDSADYCDWTLQAMAGHPGFEWTAERASDWRERPADWPPTKYEGKAIDQGRNPAYLRFARVSGDEIA